MPWRILFLVAAALGASPAVSLIAEIAPQSPPQFRAGVDLVQLDVSVLDRDRRPVTGLTAADFTLLENGRPIPIRAFTAIQLPRFMERSEASGPGAPPPDVSSNRAGHAEGRLVVILMDRTIPTGEPTLAARRIAQSAVEALGPDDLAALVSTSGGVPQNLTIDRARLIAAITQSDWSTGISKEQEAIVGKQDPLSDGRCLCGLCVLETVTRIADAAQHAPRRHKMLLFIGSSLILQSAPRAPTADVSCERRLEDARRTMDTSLALSHLTVHSIDPTGLSNVAGHTRASAPGGKPGQPRLQRMQEIQADTSQLLSEQGSLQYLPEMTGGRVVINTNRPEDKVPDIFAESSAYYVLAFERGATGRSKGGAPVEVKVSRPGARVYAQRKYQAQAPERSPAARETSPSSSPSFERLLSTLRGLLPVATRPLTMTVAAFAGTDARARVVVNVDVGAFSTGATSMPLKFALTAVDQTGREIASMTQSATVVFSAGTADGPAEANVQTQLDLPPGDYEVRMAVEDAATSTVASVFSPLAVPRFDSAPLSLSNVIVETTGRGTQTPGSHQRAASATTRRIFDRREQVSALLQVYQGTSRTDSLAPVSVRARIVDSNGAAVRDQRLSLTEKDFVNRTAGTSLDLSGLAAGRYVLAVDASIDSLTASRAVPFEVR